MPTKKNTCLKRGGEIKRRPRWTPENIARLGRKSDKVIATALDITVSAVGEKRRRMGIPPLAKKQPRWTKSMISKLG